MSDTKTTTSSAKKSAGSTTSTDSKSAKDSKASSSSDQANTKAATATSDSKTSSKPVSKSTTIQNGKGSAPRNMGPTFKKNFGKIKWGDTKKQLSQQSGHRKVKVYG